MKLPSEIYLPKAVDESWFCERFGTLQAVLRDTSIREIHVDASNVEWIDPLPLLALGNELAALAPKCPERMVIFDIGEHGHSDVSLRRSRARKFLVAHDFLRFLVAAAGLNCQVRYMSATDESTVVYSINERSEFERLVASIARSRALDPIPGDQLLLPPTTLTPATMFDRVEQLLDAAANVHFRNSQRRTAQQDSVFQRMRVVLGELCRNAFDHAYHVDSVAEPVVSIYARIRATGKASLAARRALCGEEILAHDLTSERIELYVCDTGRGILADAPQWKRSLPKNSANDTVAQSHLRSANHDEAYARLLFQFPVSRLDPMSDSPGGRLDRGEATGLYYLNSVLARSSDFSCLFSDEIRLFGVHGFSNARPPRHDRLNPIGQGFCGTGFRILIRLDSAAPPPPTWFSPANHEHIVKLLREELFASNHTPLPEEDHLGDLRRTDRSSLVAVAAGQFSKSNDPRVILRLGQAVDKNTIFRIIQKWYTIHQSDSEVHEPPTLYITDLTRSQAANFHAALSTPNQSERIFELGDIQGLPQSRIGGQKRISAYLITEDTHIVGIEISRGIGERLNLATMDLPNLVRTDSRFSREFVSGLGVALTGLRSQDSRHFWKLVLEHNANNDPLLLGPVKWWTDSTKFLNLPVYLDFGRALQDGRIASILRKSLRRTISLFPGRKFASIDPLVDNELRGAASIPNIPGVFDFESASPLLHRGEAQSDLVLVGSVEVSGATLRRVLPPSSSQIQNVIECFVKRTDVQSQISILRVSALHWIEDLGIDYSSHLPNLAGITLERERYTSYVKRVTRNVSEPRSVIRFGAGSAVGRPQLPNDMYQSFVQERLLKIGHWQFGGRHSLIEANTPLAFDHFLATNRGFLPWLYDVIDDYLKDPKRDWVVLYPAHRTARRLAKIAINYCNTHPNKDRIKFVPLHMIPSVAEGVARISDLCIARIEAVKNSSTSRRLRAIFLDMGFIEKQTLRDVRRQLTAHGIPVLGSIGLLNRSNSPAFPEEDNDRSVKAYWRWNVPILGRPGQCALCSALKGVEFLGTAIAARRRDLVPTLSTIKQQWSSAQMQDHWWESGLEPLRLNHSIQLKFGNSSHSPPTTVREGAFQKVSGSTLEWHLVDHSTTAGILAHQIELARYTGNGRCLLNFLQEQTTLDAEWERPLVFIECISGFLVVCGTTLDPWLRTEYAEELVRSVMRLEQSIAAGAIDSGKEFVRGRASMVLGLATLAIAGIDSVTKARSTSTIMNCLASFSTGPSMRGQRCCVLGPETTIFLLAALGAQAHQILGLASATTDDPIARQRLQELLESLSLSTSSRQMLWRTFAARLGRRGLHDGELIRCLQSSERSDNGLDASTACFALASMLGGSTDSFQLSLGISPSTDVVAELVSIGQELRRESGTNVRNLLITAKQHIEAVRSSFHRNLLRCAENDGTTIAVTIQKWLVDFSIVKSERQFLGEAPAIAFSDLRSTWISTRYLPACAELRNELANLIDNALRHRHSSHACYRDVATGGKAKAWIDIKALPGGLDISILNLVASDEPFFSKERTPRFLADIGGSIHLSVQRGLNNQRWYCATVSVPWLDPDEVDDKEISV